MVKAFAKKHLEIEFYSAFVAGNHKHKKKHTMKLSPEQAALAAQRISYIINNSDVSLPDNL